MSIEYPIKYEHIEGERVHPSMRGKVVPVPPRWVRLQRGGSSRYQFACLARDLEGWYPEHVREVLVDYIKNWSYVREVGTDLVIAGRVARRKQTWAAEAVINEMIMRYSTISDFSAEWLNVRKAIPWINDARKGRGEYTAIRNRTLNTKLLLVDGIMDVAEHPDGKWLINWIYEHRYDERLPTITTVGADLKTDDGRDHMIEVLGEELTDRILYNAGDYVASW
jgi:hypothetical protein